MMLVLKVRALLNQLKVYGSMDSISKELPGISNNASLRTPRVKTCSLHSPTLSSSLSVPLLKTRDPVLLRRPQLMRRTSITAPSTSIPCVKIDTSSPCSSLSLKPLRRTRVRKEMEVSPASKMPWLTNGV